jgi:hypothetical protein
MSYNYKPPAQVRIYTKNWNPSWLMHDVEDEVCNVAFSKIMGTFEEDYPLKAWNDDKYYRNSIEDFWRWLKLRYFKFKRSRRKIIEKIC